MSNQIDMLNENINWSIDRNRDNINFYNNLIHNEEVNFNQYTNRTQFNTWIPYSGEETITHIRNNYFNRNRPRSNILNNNTNVQNDVNPRTRYYETFNEIDNIIGIDENLVSPDFIPFNYIPNEANERGNRQRPAIDVSIQQMVFSEEERNCCICFEVRDNEEICKLNCEHVFCVDCLHTHLERNNSCPLCRTSIRSVRVQNNRAMDSINERA
jgi:hypothetical protein